MVYTEAPVVYNSLMQITQGGTMQTVRDTMAQMSAGDTTYLRDVARKQASSRVLSDETRQYFSSLLAGETLDYDSMSEAYFEAAASMTTRAGTSSDRRRMVARLYRLRELDKAARRNGVPLFAMSTTYELTVQDVISVEPRANGTYAIIVDASKEEINAFCEIALPPTRSLA